MFDAQTKVKKIKKDCLANNARFPKNNVKIERITLIFATVDVREKVHMEMWRLCKHGTEVNVKGSFSSKYIDANRLIAFIIRCTREYMYDQNYLFGLVIYCG